MDMIVQEEKRLEMENDKSKNGAYMAKQARKDKKKGEIPTYKHCKKKGHL
jgi:hypothetical protein